MEKVEDYNLEAIKEYLKANGLDESLANSSIFAEKFSEKTKIKFYGQPPEKLRLYFDKENNLIKSYYHDYTHDFSGRRGADIRIRKDGKIIAIEELCRTQKTVHYSINDPIGGDSIKYTIKKTTYYLDENAKNQLAKETREDYSLSREMREEDLYSNSAKITYEINDKALSDKKPSDYQLIVMMRKVSNLQRQLNCLKRENQMQGEMLKKALNFAQTVRNSRFGRFFFEKKANEILGENKNKKQLPEDRE